MDDFRFKELQLKFSALSETWAAAKSMDDRRAILAQIKEVLEESNEIIKRTREQISPRKTKFY